MQDLVSVVIPVYNREKTIKRAIDSVLCQTYANLEIIVIDDCSTDNCVKIVNGYQDKRIRVICQKEHSGASKARNVGIENAKGEYIAFQDSDDEWCINKLAVQVAYMQKNGFLVCFSPYYLRQDKYECIIPKDYQTNKIYHNNLADILKCCNVVGTPTLIFKRKVISLLGGMVFDETLMRFQEYELMLRLVQILKIGYVEVPLVTAYRTGQNISNNEQYLYDTVAKILKKHKNFLNVRSFLKNYVVYNAEFRDLTSMIQGIEKIQDVIDIDQMDLKTEIITHLYNGLECKNVVLNKLYQSAISSLEDKRFIIYGMGTTARKFYEEIKSLGIRPAGFMVSFLKPKDTKEIDGISVYTVDEYSQRDIRVIICTSLQYQSEILDNLIRQQYSNICIYNEELFDS